MVPPPIVPEIKVNDQLIKGEYAVRSAIRSILIYETTHITEGEFYLYCPSALDLTSELMELWLDGREFSVSQLFCLSDEGKESFEIQNLLLLQSIIPLCLASRGRYRPYYFCEIPGSSMITPLSCYIITPGYLIQFAEDLSTAQICRESELAEYFRNYFMSLTLRCEPLTRCSTDIRDTLNELITGTSADAMCILMDQPCPGRYFTSDIIAKYMNSSNLPYEQMFDLVNSRFSVLRNMKGEYCTIFTEKGLEEFAQSGVMSDIPQEFVTSLERSDVRMLLIKLREEIEKGSVRGLITRPMYLRLPDYLVFYADANTGIHVYTNNAFVFGAYCCNIHISEKSICRVFLDFVQSLPGSQLVYSREDVLKILEQQIEAII